MRIRYSWVDADVDAKADACKEWTPESVCNSRNDCCGLNKKWNEQEQRKHSEEVGEGMEGVG